MNLPNITPSKPCSESISTGWSISPNESIFIFPDEAKSSNLLKTKVNVGDSQYEDFALEIP